ncbi:hypothetical protein AB0L57_16030 [Nocardia sp. NPDC052254]|uniref:hypothetical protein n=1 Tax=Nocardia sp. NPDC052254 TaxID=3155681 RepID=UPI0034311245
MTKVLLAAHVLAVIVAIGPVAVAASMFPPAIRRAADSDDAADRSVAVVLHRICRVYAWIAVAVPVLGVGTASSMGVLGSPWLIASMVLTIAAAAVLGLLVLPAQSGFLTAAQAPPGEALAVAARVSGRLAMHTGIFNLLWAIVTVLMIVRPGSSTGA